MDEESIEQPQLAQLTIGIVCALHLEIAPLLDAIEPRRSQSGNGMQFYDCSIPGARVVVVEGGVGYARATKATHALIDAFSPQWILSLGLSGALIPEMEVGSIAVGRRLVRESGVNSIDMQLDLQNDPRFGLFVGSLCTTDRIIHLSAEKEALHKQTGAIAVDMESHAVASICKDRDTEFMAVRSISDELSKDLPREVLAIFGPKGTIRAGALVGSLVKRPSSWKDLWKIREDAVKAAEKLARFTLGVLPQLVSDSASASSKAKQQP